MAVGIIAEYNPFHAGHAYQISEIRRKIKNAEIIAVMSGSFTQRGTPAILDKFTRAKLAVGGGCDLVLELPFTSAVRSAQDFAQGGVNLLSELKIVDKISFGAEFSDVEKLKAAAKVFDDKNFSEVLHKKMSAGISYASAAAKILSDSTNLNEEIFKKPNTILAIEYLRALPKNIEPILIQRVGAGYAEKNLCEKFSSAAAIREEVYKHSPSWEKILSATNEEVLNELQKEKSAGLVNEEFLFRPLITKILTTNLNEVRKIFGINEGLEFRLIESAKKSKNLSGLINLMTSRRHQASRIKRLLLYFLLDLTTEKISATEKNFYVRILAFNERGKILLKKIRAESNLPIVTKLAKHLTSRNILENNFDAEYKKNLAIDIISTDLRETLFDVTKIFGRDFLTSPIKED